MTMIEEHKRKIEDAKDRLRSEVDIELRKYRRRFRVVGEAKIDEMTSDVTTDFDPQEIAKLALGHAKVAVTGVKPKALSA